MKNTLLLALLIAVPVCGQQKSNWIQVVPFPGSSPGVGRVDFFDPTHTFAVHVTAASSLGANLNFKFPTVLDTSGECLISAGLGQWNPGACSGSLAPPITISGSFSSPILSVIQSGGGAAALFGGAPVQFDRATTSTAQQLQFTVAGSTANWAVGVDGTNTFNVAYSGTELLSSDNTGIINISNALNVTSAVHSGTSVSANGNFTWSGHSFVDSAGYRVIGGTTVVIDPSQNGFFNNVTVSGTCTGCGSVSVPLALSGSSSSPILSVTQSGGGPSGKFIGAPLQLDRATTSTAQQTQYTVAGAATDFADGVDGTDTYNVSYNGSEVLTVNSAGHGVFAGGVNTGGQLDATVVHGSSNFEFGSHSFVDSGGYRQIGSTPYVIDSSANGFLNDLTLGGTGTALTLSSGGILSAGGISSSGGLTGLFGSFSGGLTVSSGGANITGNSTLAAASTPAGTSITNSGGGVGANITSGGIYAADFTDSGGSCRIGFGSGGVTCPSDVRLKRNIFSLGSELSAVMRLRPVGFNWKKSGERSDGLIAQEVKKVFPLAVHTDENGYLNISYQQLSPYLISAIQTEQYEIYSLLGLVGLLTCVVTGLVIQRK